MSKNKLKIIAILTAIIFTIAIPIVRADDENQIMPRIDSGVIDEKQDDIMLINNDNETPISTDEIQNNSNEDTTTVATENEKNLRSHGDVYLTGDNVEITNIIDGNLFVMANTVTIKSQIEGDAFIIANKITVEDTGYIFNNLFTLSESLTINGVAYNLYSISQDTTIRGYIYRDIRISSNNLNFFGTLGRNAYVNCSNINFSDSTKAQGLINGNLNYTSSQEATIPDGAVSGDVNYTAEKISNSNSIQNYIINLGTLIVTTIIVWLLYLWLAPKFLNNTSNLITTKKILPILGCGILTPIVSILASLLLIILGITSTLGIILLVSLFILIAISTSTFIIAINNIICDKLKIQKTIGKLGILIASTAIIWLISLIPFIGSIVGILAIIIGIGIIIYSLLFKQAKLI